MTAPKPEVLPSGVLLSNAPSHFSVGVTGGAINLGNAKASAIFSTAGVPPFSQIVDGKPLSDAGADKILAKLKPAKPRKIVKWKGVAKATDEKLHALYRERDTLLVVVSDMKRRELTLLLAAAAGWFLFLALLIARMVGK